MAAHRSLNERERAQQRAFPGAAEVPVGTHVRERTPGRSSRATRRVAEYLKTLGLTDPARVRDLAVEFASETAVEDPEEHARLAVALAQERYATWRKSVFQDLPREPNPLWLRAFIAETPHAFLAEPEAARALARAYGDPEAGRGPVRARFAEQTFERVELPLWAHGLLPPVVLSLGATFALLVGLGADGLSPLEVVWAGLFSFLFGFAAMGFFSALGGLRQSAPPSHVARADTLPRSVLLMPVYHESAEHVFAAVAAMRESLLATPGGEAFDIFVLSDSRDPLLAAEEERAHRRVSASNADKVPIYYRRRVENVRQKAGNLAEFFERWGHRYEFAVVLDADSLMTGATLVELVRRMHASPRLALLQAPITLFGGETLFARALQFASSSCGPAFTRGMARWAGPHGNYYGHNAALRVRAFLECCSLPTLEGKPPLGGHILSHDFVEAALLCRAGWEVRLADDLSGSFEGIPPTFPEYVARDRRWCQGNLQHFRIAFARGLQPMSRIHLLSGVAAYLAGPAWLAFLGLGVAMSRSVSPASLSVGTWVVACTTLLLLGPRVLGFLGTLANAESRRGHGGMIRLGFGMLAEAVLAAALAPLLMLHHTRIVLSILFGRAVTWRAQRRRASGGWFASIFFTHAWISAIGVAVAAALYRFAPELLLWLAPIWGPWALAVPIAALASSARLGALARRAGLFWVPSEVEPDPLMRLAEELCSLTASDQAARFRDLVLDPVLVETHIERLATASPSKSRRAPAQEQLAELRQRALRAGPAGLSEAERQTLSQDADSLRILHREAWRHWPVESWRVARGRAQVPPQSSPCASAEPLGDA